MNAATPAGLLAAFLTAAGVVLPFVGAAVTAGVVLLFAFLGIRKGFEFFRRTSHVPLPVGYSDYEGGSAGMNPDPTAYDE